MKYKITIEYDGTNYCGWQKQQGEYSIQETIVNCIHLITGENVDVAGSGRTDAGVHALGQVAHFKIKKEIEPFKLMGAINFYLKSQYYSRLENDYIKSINLNFQDISIIDCQYVDDDFHARFSAKKRYYQYKILNQRQPTALLNNRVWQVFKELNFEKMQEGTKLIIGKKDWSCFRDSDCQSNSPIKTIDKCEFKKIGNEIIFEIEAPSFLHHMVRNIVGTLVDLGLEKITLNDLENIINSKDRRNAGPTAPAYGLYFVKVDY